MKKLFLILFLLPSFMVRAQVFADPAIGNPDFVNASGTSINANAIPENQIVYLRIPVFNLDQENALPSGTCKLQIGLGMGMTPDAGFDLSNSPLNEYFSWSSITGSSGQVQIIGTLIAPLPPDFAGTAEFRLEPEDGSSTTSVNFLITNHNTTVTLSDYVPTNNTALISYIVVAGAPLPVTFTDVFAVRERCEIRVRWNVQNEVDVERYELEASTDGSTFILLREIPALGQIFYNTSFPLNDTTRSEKLFLRIRSVDHDGNFAYSKTVAVNADCGSIPPAGVYLYPNPVGNFAELNIAARTGFFDGCFNLTLVDMSGRSINKERKCFTNASTFRYQISNLSSGKYLIRMVGEKGDTYILEFEKL